jgi:hypothetical protein
VYMGCPRIAYVCTREENTLPAYIHDCDQNSPPYTLKSMEKLRMQELTVIARFVSPLLSCTEGLFPFPYADFSSLFDESRAKKYTFFHIYAP